jgi:peptidoglycan/LPS O-acetylase OafA/YrhL
VGLSRIRLLLGKVMPMKGNLRAIGWGWLVYLLGSIGFFIIAVVFKGLPGYLGYLFYLLPFIGGMVAARSLQSRPVISLVVLGVLMGLSAGGLYYLYWLLDFPVDFKGFWLTVFFAVPMCVLLALFGGAVGTREDA